MKKIVVSIFVLAISICFLQAQNDTMYIMKQGVVVSKHKVKEVDSVIFYNPIKTQQGGAAIDKDGNTYKTVTIGTQVWMSENLKTTQYNDSTAIPLVTDNTAWASLTTPAYCWYNNDAATNKNTYGALYNWYTVNTGKLCPTGWHVPSDAEWTTLKDYLTNNGYGYEGSSSDIGKSMASTSGWTTSSTLGEIGNNQTSNNSSGFTALPAGYRFSIGNVGGFEWLGNYATFWSSTEYDASYAWYRHLTYSNTSVYRGYYYYTKDYGLSVRCLQDN